MLALGSLFQSAYRSIFFRRHGISEPHEGFGQHARHNLILRVVAGLGMIGIGSLAVNLGGTATLVVRGVSLLIGMLLLTGFATPIAGIGAAAIHVGLMIFERRYDPSCTAAAALGVSLAMLGPGAWSVDARVFGRKRIV